MMDLQKILIERLQEVPEYSVNAIFADTDAYFTVIRTTIKFLVNEKGMGGVYITSTRPARAIMSRLKADKINLSNVYFIDTISYTVGGGGIASSQIAYLESPSMLEGIMLKMEWLLRKIKTENKFIFFDSINTLSIYNEEKILQEFMHILINKLRTMDIFTVVLSMGEQIPKQIESMLTLTCDETIDIRRSALMAAKKEPVYSLPK